MNIIENIMPFTGFANLNFINCFTNMYMSIEGYDGTEECYCGGKLIVCEDCTGCKTSPAKKQEQLFFYFGTMTGHTSIRWQFEGQSDMEIKLTDTDDLIDFAMKFVGYDYAKYTSDFIGHITASIDGNKPVIAEMKDTSHGKYRLINGYEGDNLVCPNFANVQNIPQSVPTCDEIAAVYVVKSKVERQYTTKDAFKRIAEVMEFNLTNDLWSTFTKRFDRYDYNDISIEELQKWYKRTEHVMWYTFNCHNFSETFCCDLYHQTDNAELRERYLKINNAYGSTHDTCWQVIALANTRDLTKKYYNELEWGNGNTIRQLIERLRENDTQVLELIKECISIMR
jgi:hypothetical protein